MKVFVLVIKDGDISAEVFSTYHNAQCAAANYCEEAWDPNWQPHDEMYDDHIIEFYQDNCPDSEIYIVEREIDKDTNTCL